MRRWTHPGAGQLLELAPLPTGLELRLLDEPGREDGPSALVLLRPADDDISWPAHLLGRDETGAA